MMKIGLTKMDRDILHLALPALGALLISPALMLSDSAIIGHWSTDSLAGLALAQTIIQTIVGLCIFLAYSTTAAVSRAIGSGQRRSALQSGVDAIWLGAVLGLIASLITWFLSDWLISCYHTQGMVASEAVSYLRIVSLGLPAILVVQAATGILRGFHDTLTPMIVAIGGAIVNVPLSIGLVHLAGWGAAGAAFGTIVCEFGMMIALTAVVTRQCVQENVSLRPRADGMLSAWKSGLPLLVRTISLRICLIALSAAILRIGTTQLAAHQIVWNLWNLLANALDALAIAAQAMIGTLLGAQDRKQVTQVSKRILIWGVIGGTGGALILLISSFIVPSLFSPDPAVQAAISTVLIIVVIGQPLSGFAFVADGILMGADDGIYLAKLMAVTMIVFLPVLWLTVRYSPGANWALMAVWVVWSAWFMGVRSCGLWLRIRTDRWMR